MSEIIPGESDLTDYQQTIEDSSESISLWQASLFEGESIASYLYRLRLQNAVSAPSSLSQALELGVVLNRWEKFRFNPFPTETELQILSQFCGESIDKLAEAFPPESERKKFMARTIRLCAACCVQACYHRLKWQFDSVSGCADHKLRLLSKCPGCEKKFAIASSLWTHKSCECGMRLTKMIKHQQRY
ncbi:MAG: TniQ family protein [Leptolyngbya sp. UWPOB_LEPTO1]|uniref:TniQ family protein n=1 Tax=Leptolyngbya sp. UWPOB_LEPTO1 TaxID=2815653 RepID=UPI001AC2FF9C|nr:TniQ family protein [Leptolyngbya sp. UWPOB_LEPTO1]MBN8560228.1 TniQ family protein [Leptolyngbya sp. UWPOB_LEPTO1]